MEKVIKRPFIKGVTSGYEKNSYRLPGRQEAGKE
jgi:hypothetical protein